MGWSEGPQHRARTACIGKGYASGVPPPLPSPAHVGRIGWVHRANPMAVISFPCCEIRRVVVHFYPEGIKGGAHPCEQQFFGRRGKPVKKMRFVPAEKAFSIAKAMQGTKGCTVSVI